MASFIGLFFEVDSKIEQQIRNYLPELSDGYCFTKENNAVVMRWKP